MICNINIWDDFLEGDDTTIQVESSDFSKEMEIEILQYIKNTIAKAGIIPFHNMEIEDMIYNGNTFHHLELRDVMYADVESIMSLLNSSENNTYNGIYLDVYSES